MYKLGNLTIIFPSYNCDKKCPFCIAKNNRKFKNTEDLFENLSERLEMLRKNDIKFEKVVLSGNGEPSLYDIEDLEICANIIKQNEDLFDGVRIHTSGNIFWEKEKFDLFNNLISNVEFDVLRCAIDSEKDMNVLGYDRDYMKAEAFKRAKKIKLDIGLTKELEKENFSKKLDDLLKDNPNIYVVRFKDLMMGDYKQSKQARWVKEKRMTKEEFTDFAIKLLIYYKSNSIENIISQNGVRILFENTGNYIKDVVFSKGELRDYSEKLLDLFKIKQMALKIDNTKELIYNEIER